jgi:hypothetical protein
MGVIVFSSIAQIAGKMGQCGLAKAKKRRIPLLDSASVGERRQAMRFESFKLLLGCCVRRFARFVDGLFCPPKLRREDAFSRRRLDVFAKPVVPEGCACWRGIGVKLSSG